MGRLIDREKVISELQAWIDDQYARDTAIDPTLVHNALALLKEQEAVIRCKCGWRYCPSCGAKMNGVKWE